MMIIKEKALHLLVLQTNTKYVKKQGTTWVLYIYIYIYLSIYRSIYLSIYIYIYI